MKKIIITGANGFVSRYFIEYLNENAINFDILGLDISTDTDLNIKYQQVNLTDKDLIYKILKEYQPDYILHLASVSSVAQSWHNPVESFVNNTNIFLNLIDSVRELNLHSRILSVGSSEEYGDYPADKMPLKENYELHPNNPYSVARASQEHLSKLYANSLGVDIVMTRSFNHIGPRQKDVFVVSSFVKQIVEIALGKRDNLVHVGNVDVIRDFLDVRDVVDAYYKILTQGKKGEVYNVCKGEGVRLKDVIYLTSNVLSINVNLKVDETRIRPSESPLIIGDNSKLKNELLWSPKYSLDKTLCDIIDYWKSEISEVVLN